MATTMLSRARWILLGGAALTGLFTAVLRDPRFGLGVAATGAWAYASLRTLEGLLDAAVAPVGNPRDSRAVFLWAAAKIGVYAVAIWALIARPFPATSLIVGVTWLPFAFVVAALLPAPRTGSDAPTRG
jgi:Na+-transporting methylmalonyl-CoA/oxaloacetate decarboxylase beta subunit